MIAHCHQLLSNMVLTSTKNINSVVLHFIKLKCSNNLTKKVYSRTGDKTVSMFNITDGISEIFTLLWGINFDK